MRLVAVPWARPRSGFTLLFEALVMAMVGEMPVASVAGLIGESDMRVWRIVHHYVDRVVEAQNLEDVQWVGIDETSSRRGHEYVSVFADLDERRAVFVVEGRDHETVQAFSCFLEMHGGDPEQVQEVCQDMSEPFLKGTLTHLPKRRSPSTGTTSSRISPRPLTRSAAQRSPTTASCWRTRGTCGLSDPRT